MKRTKTAPKKKPTPRKAPAKKGSPSPKSCAPKIHTHYDALVSPASLTPHPDNPNFHPVSQIEALCEVIRENGWRAPIVVSRLSGHVVKGHGRLAAALKLGCKVPVEYQDYATPADEARDLVADNRIAELSSLDNSKIAELRRRFKECAKGWGDTTGDGKVFQAAFDNIKEKKPKERKYPILILESQDQFDMFERLKAVSRSKSDSQLFAKILSDAYARIFPDESASDSSDESTDD